MLSITAITVFIYMSSPVTGARYHVELCRQLADFLAEPLARAHGLMPLTDVYCLFNRARGTELVSPDDLLAAAMHFQKLCGVVWCGVVWCGCR